MSKCICENCGAVNVLENEENGDWIGCSLPTGFEWNLPSGKIIPVVGAALYVDAMGGKWSRADYIAKYNIDPEIAYTNMRASIGSPKPNPIGASAATGNKPPVKKLGKY
jgi:hypothetical protein